MPAESLSTNGFVLIPSVIEESECRQIAGRITLADKRAAGSRCLLAEPWCAALAIRLRQSLPLSQLIPSDAVAVQCTYFEKSTERNWIVTVHQDLSIPVSERVAEPSLGGWSEKEGAIFVQAPEEVLKHLLAVRIHLDPCGPDDGPVHVFSGSQQLGRISPANAATEKAKFQEVVCTAEMGAALVMRPMLLHSSSKASGSSLRRVLHFLFAPPRLPLGLRWRHAV